MIIMILMITMITMIYNNDNEMKWNNEQIYLLL